MAQETRLLAAVQRCPRGDSESDPGGWLGRSLAIVSICDGWPDPRDAFLEGQWLHQRAQDLGLPEELDLISQRSSRRCAEELLSGKGSLNQRRWP